MKVLITGGSGFIGTNLLGALIKNDEDVLNIDIKKPLNPSHFVKWVDCNILDSEHMTQVASNFKPDLLINLAAETNLVVSQDLTAYQANTQGVSNVVKLCKNLQIGKAIFFSSMLVHSRASLMQGIVPKPDTDYGRSKLLGEKIVFKSKLSNVCDVSVLRPTSIWGPWFGAPYDHFFQLASKKILIFPDMKMAKKTFGYIENTVTQVLDIIYGYAQFDQSKPMYLADQVPIEISDFLNKIRKAQDLRQIIRLPKNFFYIGAKFGDLLGKQNINFPLTSYRWENLIMDRIVDADEILFNQRPISIESGIQKTLEWSQQNKKALYI